MGYREWGHRKGKWRRSPACTDLSLSALYGERGTHEIDTSGRYGSNLHPITISFHTANIAPPRQTHSDRSTCPINVSFIP